MSRYDSGNTAYSPNAKGPRESVTERWTVDPGGAASGTPAIGSNVVFLPTTEGLYALDSKTGETRWQYSPSTNPTMTDPAIHEGVVYTVDSVWNTVSALDAPSGNERWKRDDIDALSTGPFLVVGQAVREPTLFIGTKNGHVHRLNVETGETTWQTDLFGTITAFGYRLDQLYIGTSSGHVFSYLFPSRELEEAGHRKVDSPVESIVPAEDATLVETLDGPFQFWKGNFRLGATDWTLDSSVANTPAVSTGNTYFFAGTDAVTARRDYDREEYWTIEGNYNRIAPVAAGDRLYAKSDDHLHAFALDDESGFLGRSDAERWSYPLPGQVVTGISVADGALFVAIGLRRGSEKPTLYCLEEAP